MVLSIVKKKKKLYKKLYAEKLKRRIRVFIFFSSAKIVEYLPNKSIQRISVVHSAKIIKYPVL